MKKVILVFTCLLFNTSLSISYGKGPSLPGSGEFNCPASCPSGETYYVCQQEIKYLRHHAMGEFPLLFLPQRLHRVELAKGAGWSCGKAEVNLEESLEKKHNYCLENAETCEVGAPKCKSVCENSKE